jgi:hypothetical protein
MANIDLYNKRKQTEATSMKCTPTSFYTDRLPQLAVQPFLLGASSNGHVKGNDAFLRRISANFSLDNRGGLLAARTGDANSMRWLQDWMDDLDVQIAMNDFEEAVKSIEKGMLPKCAFR